MRSILLISDEHLSAIDIKPLLSTFFLSASLHEVDHEHALDYLLTGPSPDLIIYAPKAVGKLGRKFRRIKALAGRARILLYSRFGAAGNYLFDYLAIGVNGILSMGAEQGEQRQAIDTVLRGDSFVDKVTRYNMLSGKNRH